MSACAISCTLMQVLAPSLVPKYKHLHHLLECLYHLLQPDDITWTMSCTWAQMLVPSLAPGHGCLYHLLHPDETACTIFCAWVWWIIQSLVSRHELLHHPLYPGANIISWTQAWALPPSLTPGHECLCHLLQPSVSVHSISCTQVQVLAPSLEPRDDHSYTLQWATCWNFHYLMFCYLFNYRWSVDCEITLVLEGYTLLVKAEVSV